VWEEWQMTVGDVLPDVDRAIKFFGLPVNAPARARLTELRDYLASFPPDTPVGQATMSRVQDALAQAGGLQARYSVVDERGYSGVGYTSHDVFPRGEFWRLPYRPRPIPERAKRLQQSTAAEVGRRAAEARERRAMPPTVQMRSSALESRYHALDRRTGAPFVSVRLSERPSATYPRTRSFDWLDKKVSNALRGTEYPLSPYPKAPKISRGPRWR
jgi:hypothetical protein